MIGPIEYLYKKEHKRIKRKCRICNKKTKDVISGSFVAGYSPKYMVHHYWCSEECAKKERALQKNSLANYYLDK